MSRVAGMIVLVAVASSVMAATDGEADRSPASAVLLEVMAPKEAFLLGEPVDLMLRYTNMGAGPIEFLPRLQLDWDFVSCDVVRPDGKTMEFRPGVSGFPSPNARVRGISLAPGESCLERLNLTVGAVSVPWLSRYRTELDYTFDHPGEYRVRVTYRNHLGFAFAPGIWKGEAVSDEVTVRIEEPPDGEKDAYEAWQQRPIMVYLAHFGTAHGPEEIAAFEDFLRKHPQSVYADYARVYLADCYARINPHQPAKALACYCEVLAAGKPQWYLPEVEVAAADCHRQLGQLDDARRMCEAIVARQTGVVRSRPTQLAEAILKQITAEQRLAAASE